MPGAAGIVGAIDTVPVPDAALRIVLAGADPQRGRVPRIERDRADRVRSLPVKDRSPRGAAILGLPHAARRSGGVDHGGIARIDRDAHDATADHRGPDQARAKHGRDGAGEPAPRRSVIQRAKAVRAARIRPEHATRIASGSVSHRVLSTERKNDRRRDKDHAHDARNVHCGLRTRVVAKRKSSIGSAVQRCRAQLRPRPVTADWPTCAGRCGSGPARRPHRWRPRRDRCRCGRTAASPCRRGRRRR